MSGAIEVRSNCDIPANNLRNFSIKDEKLCSAACTKEEKCRGFTFISHWNRCFLKERVEKIFDIEMHAGQVLQSPSPRSLGPIKAQSDSTGKDIRIINAVENIESCSIHCLNDIRCQSFAFIQGYGTCALKKDLGKIVEKIFFCGKKL
jgi:hypothetical protein